MALISRTFCIPKILCNTLKPALFDQARRGKAKAKPRAWPFVILRPDKDDYDEILDLMWCSYFIDEPVIKALGLGNSPSNIMDEHVLKALSQGLSLIARCKYDGCIAGACINEGTCPWDPDARDKFACSLCNMRLRQLHQFYAYLQRAPDLWTLACASKIFEISMLCVKPNDRGKGLGTALVRQAIETGADCGHGCIRLDATSVKTQAICEKLKMKLIYEIPYCTYVGPNNKPVITPAPPDTAVKIYVATPLLPKK